MLKSTVCADTTSSGASSKLCGCCGSSRTITSTQLVAHHHLDCGGADLLQHRASTSNCRRAISRFVVALILPIELNNIDALCYGVWPNVRYPDQE
jgi:hypothetical protein